MLRARYSFSTYFRSRPLYPSTVQNKVFYLDTQRGDKTLKVINIFLPCPSSPVLVPEDTACCPAWRPCCCSRSCAHRPTACASASPSPAPISCATTRCQSGSGATRTSLSTPPWMAGHPSCSPPNISHPPPRPPPLPSPAGKKGLQVPQTTASWAERSSEGRCSATAAKETGGAGWPCPWTSRPTSWTSSLTWPRPKTCGPRQPRMRGCWLTSDGGSELVVGQLTHSHDQCWPLRYSNVMHYFSLT